jgi:DNA-binding transcriptional LysR family regulator
LCASPEYLRQHSEPEHPRDLAGHRIISYTYWTEKVEWTFAGPNGDASVHIEPLIHTNNGDTCRTAALEHHGIILQPDFLIGADLQRGALVEVMRDYRSIELGIYAVYPSRKHLPVRMRRLLDFLAESFKQPSWGSSGGG